MERVNIAVASPNDVSDEHNAVLRILNRWNSSNDIASLSSLTWRTTVPALGDHPQHLLNKDILERSQLLVAIFWSKLGTPTPTAPSGTVEEIREFIRLKGPGRVMVYFCTRDLPHNIDTDNLLRLRQFKSELQSQGLYHEYKTVEQFEVDLYYHLDSKVRDLLAGKFPLPKTHPPATAPELPTKTNLPADIRLREVMDFGFTLHDISNGFDSRMTTFRQINGATNDKFLNLGAHVYNSVAFCLDRFLTFHASTMKLQHKMVVSDISARLKHLAASHTDYHRIGFALFWTAGDDIAKNLLAHVTFLKSINVLI